LATETRSVLVEANGALISQLGSLIARASARGGERWLAVRVMPGAESRRVKLETGGSFPVTVQVVTDTAITANGMIESIAQGFRFPDGSVQTSAATVSGGVPSVNGIGAAVTITGAATVSVGTAGSAITVTGPAFGNPVSVAPANAQGAAVTVSRSDHTHAHGDQTVETLHAAATTGTAGFLSATDKTKLNAATKYVRTITVRPDTGNASSNGIALVAALSGISGNSATDPYLIKIEPGVYNIGILGLIMKPFVDVEGSGENETFINATRGDIVQSASAAAVVGAADSELRSLTVTNGSTSLFGTGFHSTGAGTRRISNVTIHSSGGTNTSFGVYATTGATVTAFGVTVTATGGGGTTSARGFETAGATINIFNSTVTGKGVGGTGTNIGVKAGGSANIDSSTIVGTGVSSSNQGVSVVTGTVTVTNSTVRVDTGSNIQAVATLPEPTAILSVFHSRLLAGSPGLSATQVSIARGVTSTLRVATSLVDSASLGQPTCVHVYNSTFGLLGGCPGPGPV
jgi:hypothetical protein